MRVSFTKMQSLGNDFVVIDGITHDLVFTAAMVGKIADRHFGVGCDQILLLELPPQTNQNVDFFYRVFNADGSEVGQCGNGIRCLAKLIKIQGLSQKQNLVFATKSRQMSAYLEEDDQVTVGIGLPIFEPKRIPFAAEKQTLSYNLTIANYNEVKVGVVSVGNPHAVVLVDDVVASPVETLGPLLAKNKFFPEGVNVNFMQVVDRSHIKLRVLERGSGETLACGSGACASVVIGRLWGVLESAVTVNMSGGDLLVKWNGMGEEIYQTGPAELVFNGEIIL